MKAVLELLHVQRKDGKRPCVIRFAINRKTYRYQLEQAFTKDEWKKEQKNAYPNSKASTMEEEKASQLLDRMDLENFDYEVFKAAMKLPFVPTDSITRWWAEYDKHRDKKGLAVRTRGLDNSAKKMLDEYFIKHPQLNNIHAWNADELGSFQQWIVKKPKAIDTAKIYLEQIKTFFFWLIDGQEEGEELLTRNPFKKYTIPEGTDGWAPYAEEEVKMIFGVQPQNPRQEHALRWSTLVLYAGGQDTIDFAEMRWTQMRFDTVHVVRVKSDNSKLLYMSQIIKEVFGDLPLERKGKKPDDYVFNIYKNDATESQNNEHLKKFLKNVNLNMQEMLKDTGIEFTLKRLRPTAAMIANDSTKDINYVKQMLVHSNISQTDTYLKRLPNAVNKKNQGKYERAVQKIIG